MSRSGVLTEIITNRIFLIRARKVMIDHDLAELYGVPTKVLNQAVKRNVKRFPEDFMMLLTLKEKNQLVTICDRFNSLKHSSAMPRAFTEQGVAMLATVLNSDRAIHVNIEIMRAFVRLREILMTHKNLAKKLMEMEKKYDSQFSAVFQAIRQLMREEEGSKTPIGFHGK